MTTAPEKLKEHFEEHFAQRNMKPQSEVENPENTLHIIPPDDVLVNEDIPTEDEIRTAMKFLKNNKCAGTDDICKTTEVLYIFRTVVLPTASVLVYMGSNISTRNMAGSLNNLST